MSEPVLRKLGTGWRWLPCEQCGSTNSHRVETTQRDGVTVICKNREACEQRQGRGPLTREQRERALRARLALLEAVAVAARAFYATDYECEAIDTEALNRLGEALDALP